MAQLFSMAMGRRQQARQNILLALQLEGAAYTAGMKDRQLQDLDRFVQYGEVPDDKPIIIPMYPLLEQEILKAEQWRREHYGS